MKLLLYCTQARPYLTKISYNYMIFSHKENKNTFKPFNGKVVAECDFEVHKFETLNRDIEPYEKFNRSDLLYIFERSNLSYNELIDYLGENNVGYAIRIKNLKVFDEPKDIVHYGTNIHYDDEGWTETNTLWKAPGRIIKVYDDKWNPYFFFPMQSEELYKVLRRQQTIIIRKKILKDLLNQGGKQ